MVHIQEYAIICCVQNLLLPKKKTGEILDVWTEDDAKLNILGMDKGGYRARSPTSTR